MPMPKLGMPCHDMPTILPKNWKISVLKFHLKFQVLGVLACLPFPMTPPGFSRSFYTPWCLNPGGVIGLRRSPSDRFKSPPGLKPSTNQGFGGLCFFKKHNPTHNPQNPLWKPHPTSTGEVELCCLYRQHSGKKESWAWSAQLPDTASLYHTQPKLCRSCVGTAMSATVQPWAVFWHSLRLR